MKSIILTCAYLLVSLFSVCAFAHNVVGCVYATGFEIAGEAGFSNGSMANAGSQYANSASNTFGNLSNAQTGILGQQANARASGYAGQANAITGGLNSLTNLYGMSKWGK